MFLADLESERGGRDAVPGDQPRLSSRYCAAPHPKDRVCEWTRHSSALTGQGWSSRTVAQPYPGEQSGEGIKSMDSWSHKWCKSGREVTQRWTTKEEPQIGCKHG